MDNIDDVWFGSKDGVRNFMWIAPWGSPSQDYINCTRLHHVDSEDIQISNEIFDGKIIHQNQINILSDKTLYLERQGLPEGYDDIYSDCVSFNTEMSIMDVVALSLLTTTQFLVAKNYNIVFRMVNLNRASSPRWVGFSKIFKDSFNAFATEISEQSFDSVEQVTNWQSDHDGKNLKPRIKNKFRYLLQTQNNISFKYDGIIYWGEFIKIVQHPYQKIYENKVFFVYDSDIERGTTKVKAFLVSEQSRRG
jgi:hypothetical protein